MIFSYPNSDSEPFNNIEIPNTSVQQTSTYTDYLGDEYYESSIYSSNHHANAICSSPKISKTLPININSTTSFQQKATTPSIMTAAGAGLSSLFNSLSNTLQSTAVTQSVATTSYSTPYLTNISKSSDVGQSSYDFSHSSYAPITSSYLFSSAYSPVSTSSIFSTNLVSTSALTTVTTDPIFSSAFQVTPMSYTFTSSYTPFSSSIFSPAYSSVTTSNACSYLESLDKISSQTSSSSYNPNYSPNIATISSTSENLVNLTGKNDLDYSLTTQNSSFESNYTSTVPTTKMRHDHVVVSTSSSSFFGALTSIFDVGAVSTTATHSTSLTSTSYVSASSYSSNNTYNTVISSYNINPMPPNYSLSLGHSPIPEEDLENEMMVEELQLKAEEDKTLDIENHYSTITKSYVGLDDYIPTSISESYYERKSIYDTIVDENVEEEYHEDFEDGVEPVPVISSDINYSYIPITTSTISPPTTTTVSSDYFYENSTYPMTTKLSTIPETANDTYLSNTDLQDVTEVFEEQLTTPGAYDYTDNENDYIASGDLKNTNLIPNCTSQSAPSYQFSNQTTLAANMSNQPETKKSRFGFGSFLSDGLNAIGSSVNTIKSTATNLAGGAVGVVVGAAAAAAQSTQGSNSQNAVNNLIKNQNIQDEKYVETSMNGQSTSKLTKQVSELYEDHHENYTDQYGANQHQQQQVVVLMLGLVS